jgi:hypothetical protein
MASKFDSSLEVSPFDQAILRIVWRNEKGHIGNTWRNGFFYQKGHGAAPFYFSLDKTLHSEKVKKHRWQFSHWHTPTLLWKYSDTLAPCHIQDLAFSYIAWIILSIFPSMHFCNNLCHRAILRCIYGIKGLTIINKSTVQGLISM